MTKSDDTAHGREELAGLLETWGSDASRWPPRVRLRIAELTLNEPGAERTFAEARALDRLLDTTRNRPAALSADHSRQLTDRIVAAAAAVAPPALAESNVVPLQQRSRLPTTAQRTVRWPAAGLIAASLAAGFFLGGSLNLAPVLQELLEVAGLPTVIDPGSALMGDDLGEEETL